MYGDYTSGGLSPEARLHHRLSMRGQPRVFRLSPLQEGEGARGETYSGDSTRERPDLLCTTTLPGTAIGHSTAGAERAEPRLAGDPLAVVVEDSCPGLFSLAEFTKAVCGMDGTEPASPGTVIYRSVVPAGRLAEERVNWEHARIHSLSPLHRCEDKSLSEHELHNPLFKQDGMAR